ncbi:MAG: VCBS repeat-containing protein [Bacteroidota bacterium]
MRVSKHLLVLIPILLIISLLACQTQSDPPSEAPLSSVGEKLARIHCSSCHLFPEPKSLDQKTWERFVLLRMAAFLGIYHDGVQYYDSLLPQWKEPGIGGQRVIAAGVYPEQPRLSREDWEAIRDFYLQNAPQKLAPANTYPINPSNGQFKTHKLLTGTEYAAYVQAIEIDTSRSELLVSLYQQDVIRIDTQSKVLGRLGRNNVVTDIDLSEERLTLTAMGSRFGLDTPTGNVQSGRSLQEIAKGKTALQLDSLQRPVDAAWVDLNGDGKDDFVLAAFGNYLGELALYMQTENKRFAKQVLWPEDGCVKVEIADLNQDDRPDIVALMGNGDEGIDIYLNQGEGNFQRKRVLRFPPTYGSTYFELVDFDQDGKLDILYTNGDNGDYPPILKFHHGIRLYRQEDNLAFREAFYLPLNGGYRAQARDFDLDGDMDIFSVAYHPNFGNPAGEGLVYWEQKAPAIFVASSISVVGDARWMVFETGDLDRDGDEDIVLGAFNARSQELPPGLSQHWETQNIPLIWLENLAKN